MTKWFDVFTDRLEVVLKMETRTIAYIDPNEDILDIEVETAANRSMEENLMAYCEFIIANYAMAEIDVLNYPVSREIYYVEHEY